MASLHEQDYAVPVPYTSRLLSKVEAGQTLVVHGKVNSDAKSFQINLLDDSPEIDTHIGSVPLHVSVRFDEGKIVLNTMQGGQWGKEERYSNKLEKGDEFEIRIRVHDDKYEITQNHKHLADFKHRLGFNSLDYFQIKGDVTLDGVHWGGRYFTLPFRTDFRDGNLKAGQRVYIYGVPKGNFSVNFIGPSGGTLFHFNPRFTEKAIVRNTEDNGQWGNEEREGHFPFQKNVASIWFFKMSHFLFRFSWTENVLEHLLIAPPTHPPITKL